MSDKWIALHGHCGSKKWPSPKLVAASNEAGRKDQGNNIKANEYLDSPQILRAKMEIVANLIRQAKCCVAYTGAGLSKASGIPDYATKAKDSVVAVQKIKNPLQALPTKAHCVLTAMERQGFLHHYVQQNHDGLPQKAGFPQEKINEIHGAWFDPSNRVVQFNESLRGDLFAWMAEMEKKADLCLCLGTSLSGMNADRCARTPAKRSRLDPPTALGTIIINLQCTPLDDMCAVRVWAKLDDAFAILQELLELEIRRPPEFDNDRVAFALPYDEHGNLDWRCSHIFEVSKGSKVCIPVEDAKNQGATGEFIDPEEHYVVRLTEGDNRIRDRVLGKWWIDTLMRGAWPTMPVMNMQPRVTRCKSSKKAKKLRDSFNGSGEPEPEPIPEMIQLQQGHVRVESKENEHQWTLRVQPEQAHFVAKVTYQLHPTFLPNCVTVNDAPFEISRRGWGTFQVQVKIQLKPQYGNRVIETAHKLSFKSEGDVTRVTDVSTGA
jgi:NAD-dependent SIR2 family protein deacetylase